MRRLLTILTMCLGLMAPMTLMAQPASADPGSPACVTLKEWRKIKKNMTRPQVRRIVGFKGRAGRVTRYSDGTIDFSVSYRMCRPGSKKPDAWMTTTMYFETSVKYGRYVWNDMSEWVDGECLSYDYEWDYCEYESEGHWQGAYEWDEYAENGHTTIPRLSYKGSY